MFTSLIEMGYSLKRVDYIEWRKALMELTISSADHALYPLLHFVLDDLPTSTKSALLDDRNSRFVCEREIERRGMSGLTLRCDEVHSKMKMYVEYFAKVGFLENMPWMSEKSEWQNVSMGIRNNK
jgi:L-aminoadipate-semialdehyde dehydrogenase